MFQQMGNERFGTRGGAAQTVMQLLLESRPAFAIIKTSACHRNEKQLNTIQTGPCLRVMPIRMNRVKREVW